MSMRKGSPHQRADAAPWDDAAIIQIGKWVAEGRSKAFMADTLGITRTGFTLRCERLGIPVVANTMAESQAKGLAVLKKHYANHPDLSEVRRLYVRAVGRDVSIKRMGEHANRHGIKRNTTFRVALMASALAGMKAHRAAQRVEKAKLVQALIDSGMSMSAAAESLGHGDDIIRRMRMEGLIVVPGRENYSDAVKAAQAVKSARFAARRAAFAVKVQALIDDGAPLARIYQELDIGAVFVRRMRREGLVNMPIQPPKPPRVAKDSLTTAPKVSRALPTILFGSKDIRRPVVGPVQSVEEFLAAGGKVTTCPAVAVAATTATISDADRAAAAAHTMARGGYGYTDTWRAINKRIQTAAKKAKAEAESRSGHDEQMRIAA